LDLLQQAGIANARLLVIAVDDPAAALDIARQVRKRWPTLPIVARARSRTDAYEFEALGIRAIRETFHSALEAAEQSLRALGEQPHTAWRLVRHFERHDRELLNRARAVRHDQQALIGITEQGRRDLQALLQSEHAQRGPDGASGLEEGWTHLRAPDDDRPPS
ncbi:MAG TPA: NAD-binding protein, partial [Burkholderiaceae bacterium]|nr:NAD-binding protein [Burkholderiaceae bacterium]